jgi:DNA-binding MarR family transcriptional regulator
MSRHFFELILAIKRKCQGNEEQIQEELGLSQAEFNGLLVLEDGQEITGCEFAERMVLSPSRGSRVLGKLVADGFVATRVSPRDRRTVLISLAPKGVETKRQIIGRMEACEGRISGSLDEITVGKIKESLQVLEAVL